MHIKWSVSTLYETQVCMDEHFIPQETDYVREELALHMWREILPHQPAGDLAGSQDLDAMPKAAGARKLL